jgi:hypothetical protein
MSQSQSEARTWFTARHAVYLKERESLVATQKALDAIEIHRSLVGGEGIVGIGLFRCWCPVVAEGVVQGVLAGVSLLTLARMLTYLGVDALTSEIPVVGDAVDFFWQGHLMAATALQKDVEDRHGAPADVPLNRRARKKGRKVMPAV